MKNAPLLASLTLCAACFVDPPRGPHYALKTSVASIDGDHVVVEATVLNTGDEQYDQERCIRVTWWGPGVASRDGGAQNDLPVTEKQEQCAKAAGGLPAGQSDSFHIVSQHSRAELMGREIFTMTTVNDSNLADFHLSQMSP